MHIIQVAIECTPIIKVGGLGDMVSGLSRALAHHHHVEIIIPYYSLIPLPLPTKILKKTLFSYSFLGKQKVAAVSYEYDGCTLTCLELHSQHELFATSSVYTPDDALRFCAFSVAATAYIQQLESVDIVHIHDWHVGLIAGLLKSHAIRTGKPSPTCILTIHNFAYQGECSTQILASSDILAPCLQAYQMQHSPQSSVLLQGAVTHADHITTVSPSYAREILQNHSSKDVDQAIKNKSQVFSGILNGIDQQVWNPATDSALKTNYDSSLLNQPQEFLAKKRENKTHLYERLHISAPKEQPCLCVISRLEEQKGLTFMKLAILHAMEHGYTFVLIGTSGNPNIQQQFVNIQTSVAHSPNIRLVLSYDETLARLLYAAADMICIPSLFEPCGLTQLIAMRYGTVPIVRATGGLADTVKPLVQGFTFSQIKTHKEFYNTLSLALHVYQQNPEWWFQLIKNGMHASFDAASMADRYLDIYRKAQAKL